MRNTIFIQATLGLLLVCALAVAGCAGDSPSAMSSAEKDRLSALEKEVHSLKVEASAREAAFKEELALIRKNLESIRSLMEVEKERAKVEAAPKNLDEELDTKAKSFVSENLDRLLSLTKKLLDKMEKELDDQIKKDTPAPKGDEI